MDSPTHANVSLRATAALTAVNRMRETDLWLPSKQIVLTEPPRAIRGRNGVIVGVDAMIRAFRRDTGAEIPIDPHRILVNPPVGGEFKDTFWQWLTDDVEQRPHPEGFGTKGTVTTVYADMSGYVESENSVWLSTRVGSSLLANTGSATFDVGAQYTGDGDETDYWYAWEAFLNFDTSVITGIVSAATLTLYTYSKTGDDAYTLEARASSFGSGITTSDWVAGASLSSLTLLASKDADQFSAFSSEDLASEFAFLAAINQSGDTQILVCPSTLRSSSAPNPGGYVRFSSVNESGTSNDPKLVITHATPVTRSAVIL